MMEATPATALEVPEPKFLLEFLIVALDPPAQLGQSDQTRERRVGRQVGEPVLGRFFLPFWPLGQQPQLGPGLAAVIVPMSRADPQGGEARGESALAALAPGHGLPCPGRQGPGKRLGRHRLVPGLTPQPGRRPAPT